jgi:16S rRNA G966 N2-methylase RsmD
MNAGPRDHDRGSDDVPTLDAARVGCRGMACCDARGCDEFFGDRFAQKMAARYRKRGLNRTAERMVDFLEARGLAGATVLEIGGGVGEIEIELLKRGAASAVNLELSTAYDTEAVELMRQAGFEGRMERRVADIAADAAGVDVAAVVVLHRVVCCYPDYERLLTAAAEHTRRIVVFSHPPRNLLSRLFFGLQNLVFRVRGLEFRTFTHPPAAMLAVLERRGLRRTFGYRGLVWRVVGLERDLPAEM